MDKVNRKSHRLNGHKNNKIGVPLGIHDKNGKELKSGDEILYFGEKCIILWNDYRYAAMIMSSCWYGDLDRYNAKSYGKCYWLHMDDGARMEIEVIKEAENEDRY